MDMTVFASPINSSLEKVIIPLKQLAEVVLLHQPHPSNCAWLLIYYPNNTPRIWVLSIIYGFPYPISMDMTIFASPINSSLKKVIIPLKQAGNGGAITSTPLLLLCLAAHILA